MADVDFGESEADTVDDPVHPVTSAKGGIEYGKGAAEPPAGSQPFRTFPPMIRSVP